MLDPWAGEQKIRGFVGRPDRASGQGPEVVERTRASRWPEPDPGRGSTSRASLSTCHTREVNNIFVRAIITGFGLRIGSELGKLVADRLLPKPNKDEDDDDDDDDDDDGLGSVTPDPPPV